MCAVALSLTGGLTGRGTCEGATFTISACISASAFSHRDNPGLCSARHNDSARGWEAWLIFAFLTLRAATRCRREEVALTFISFFCLHCQRAKSAPKELLVRKLPHLLWNGGPAGRVLCRDMSRWSAGSCCLCGCGQSPWLCFCRTLVLPFSGDLCPALLRYRGIHMTAGSGDSLLQHCTCFQSKISEVLSDEGILRPPLITNLFILPCICRLRHRMHRGYMTIDILEAAALLPL